MKRNILLSSILFLLFSQISNATDYMPKLSGFLQTGWNYTETVSSFEAKRFRVYMKGNVSEKISYLARVENFNDVSGTTFGNLQKNIRLTDAYFTVAFSPEVQVVAGQFVNPLGFENYDINAAYLETVDFSNVAYRIAGRNPYEFNFTDTGHDLGVMVHGGLFEADGGFRRLEYYLALTNGSVSMKDDTNKSKDVYFSLGYRPVKHLLIKGNICRSESKSMSLAGGDGVGSGDYNSLFRFIGGIWYDNPEGLVVRSEFGCMHSGKLIDENGAYILAAYNIGRFHPVLRYDYYRDRINGGTSHNFDRVLAGVNVDAMKGLRLQANINRLFYSHKAQEALSTKGISQFQLMAVVYF